MNHESSPWRLAELDPPTVAQADELSSFLQGQLPGHRHPEKEHFTRWKLCDNPVRPGFASAMVTEPGGRTVSLCTVTPKRLWLGGEELPCGEIGDTFTDAAYLRKGMFAACVDGSRSRAQAAGLSVIYGLPNDQSLPGYTKKLNFAVKNSLRFEAFYAVLSTRSLGVRTRAAQMPALRGLLCHPLVVGGTRRAAGLLYAAAAPRVPGLRVEIERSFGADYDDLWRRVRPSLPVALVRDARYLDWRFSKNPFPFAVLAARLDGALVGYVATLTVRHGEEGPFAHTLLLDWLYDSGRAPAVDQALLAGALRHALASQADVISAVCPRESPAPLPFGRLGFVRRPREMPLIVHRNPAGEALLASGSPWHFTLGDTDAF